MWPFSKKKDPPLPAGFEQGMKFASQEQRIKTLEDNVTAVTQRLDRQGAVLSDVMLISMTQEQADSLLAKHN